MNVPQIPYPSIVFTFGLIVESIKELGGASKDIQIDSNSFHIITRTQFPIQLDATHTIHQTQRLTLDYLTFDPTNVYKHGLTYIKKFML
jgi:hypothetical protein